MKLRSVIFFTFFPLTFLFAQVNFEKTADSILSNISGYSDKDKLAHILSLTESDKGFKPKTLIRVFEEGLRIAGNQRNRTAPDLLNIIGEKYSDISENQKALSSYEKAMALSREIKYLKGECAAENGLGVVLSEIGQYSKAIEMHQKAILIAENNNLQKEASDAYNNLGTINYLLGDFEKSEQMTLIALKIRTQINYMRGLSASNENLGVLSFKQKKYNAALKYHKEALRVWKIIGNKSGIGGSLENIAIVYREMKKFRMAIDYYYRSLAIRNEIDDHQGIASVYSGIGRTYQYLGILDSALSFQKYALKLRRSIGYGRGIASSYSRISSAYEAMGDYNEALVYYKKYFDVTDSLFNAVNSKNIAEMQARFETEKKDKEIRILQKNNEIAANLRNSLFIVIFLITLLIAVILYSYRSIKKTNGVLNLQNDEINKQKIEVEKLNTELSAINVQKDKLFNIIAHDLKSPFTAILGLSDFMASETEVLAPAEIRTYACDLNNSSKRVYALLENLLQWSQMNSGRLDFNPELIDVRNKITELIKLYDRKIKEKKLFVSFDIEGNETAYLDGNMMESVIRNLFYNAIKYTRESGNIKIKAVISDMMVVTIEDDGVGIDAETMNNLFTFNLKSQAGTSKEKGTGLGLIICKEMIEKNNGSIKVESQPGKYTKFTVNFGNIKVPDNNIIL